MEVISQREQQHPHVTDQDEQRDTKDDADFVGFGFVEASGRSWNYLALRTGAARAIERPDSDAFASYSHGQDCPAFAVR